MKRTISSFTGEGIISSPGARARTPGGRRPVSRCPFSCSAVTVDPAQLAEIDFLDDGLAAAAAAAAMSMVPPVEEALALEVALVRLGAMAYVRSERARSAACGKETDAREKRNLGMKGTGEELVPPHKCFIKG